MRAVFLLFVVLSSGCGRPPVFESTLRLFEGGEVTDEFALDCNAERATVVRYLSPGDLSPTGDTEEPWLELVVHTDDCLGYPQDVLPAMQIFAESARYAVPRMELRVPDSAEGPMLVEDTEVIVQAGEVLAMGRSEGTTFSMRVQEARSEDADFGDCACDSVQFLDAHWRGSIDSAVDRDPR